VLRKPWQRTKMTPRCPATPKPEFGANELEIEYIVMQSGKYEINLSLKKI
jgi:hypothetical protein